MDDHFPCTSCESTSREHLIQRSQLGRCVQLPPSYRIVDRQCLCVYVQPHKGSFRFHSMSMRVWVWSREWRIVPMNIASASPSTPGKNPYVSETPRKEDGSYLHDEVDKFRIYIMRSTICACCQTFPLMQWLWLTHWMNGWTVSLASTLTSLVKQDLLSSMSWRIH